VREYLRSLPVFGGAIAAFDPQTAPESPIELFEQWLRYAAEAGVCEPHAMTLSTRDADGAPDGRVLILKDIDTRGWWFASNSDSAKGFQLVCAPYAALTFYWPQVGRQVRVRGTVKTGTPEHNAADFRARGSGARAVALASEQSRPLTDLPACARAVEKARDRLRANPELVAPGWRTYVLHATTVEFWNADKDRQHVRLQYRTADNGWTRSLLWP
jgi:pyridoxamine 5'-phosphate oxidase